MPSYSSPYNHIQGRRWICKWPDSPAALFFLLGPLVLFTLNMGGSTLQCFEAGSSCSDSGLQLHGYGVVPSELEEDECGPEDEDSESEEEEEAVGS